MPPLKVKTNLPNAKSAAAPYNTALKKKQINAGMEAKVAKKPTAKNVKTATVTKGKVQASRKKVEVEIVIGDVDDELDELLEDDEKKSLFYGGHGQAVAASTLQHFKQPHSRLASILSRAGTPTEDPGYWSGNGNAAEDDDQESINSLIDDLLKPKTVKAVATLKRAINTVPVESKDNHRLNKAEAASNTTLLGEIGEKCVEGGNTVSAQQSTKDASLITRLQEEPISSEHFDLAHTVVLKVLEFAMKKNVDWFTMAKELEAAGLINAKPTKAAKGRGKAKGKKEAEENELESDEVSSKPAKMPKVDGTFLCKSFSESLLSRLSFGMDLC
jgi:hypothetical protein